MTDSEPTPRTLAQQLAVLEERMNTKQQEYKTDIANLATDLAKRDTRLLLAIFGIIAAVMTLGLTILGLVLTGS